MNLLARSGFLWFLCFLQTHISLSKLVSEQVACPPPSKSPVDQYTQGEVKDFMQKFGQANHSGSGDNTSITYAQIYRWFVNQSTESDREAKSKYRDVRLFSLCVTPTQIENFTPAGHHLKKFQTVFDQMYNKSTARPFYDFIKEKDTFSVFGDKSWIKDLTLHRINTPESDMVNLRQWFHIVVETVPLKGLYVQALVGPLGLPVGEFSVEFPCQDDLKNTKDIDVVGQIFQCHYRPRTAMSHPHIYVGVSDTPRERFHLHYKWSDITCLESPYLQFLLIAVKEFSPSLKLDLDYKPILSPVWLNTNFDSRDGAPYPYYINWRDKMHCFQKHHSSLLPPIPKKWKNGTDPEFAKFFWITHGDVFRIQPNEGYDLCVWGPENKDRDEFRFECPPGPFECDDSYATIVKDRGEAALKSARDTLVKIENCTRRCFPCYPPRCSEQIGFTPEECAIPFDETINISEIIKEVADTVATKVSVNSHGIIALFACLVVIPISNYISRFDKEIRGNFLFGNGPWLYIHVGGHVLSLIVMWLSTGPVASDVVEYQLVYEECLLLAKNNTKEARSCAVVKGLQNPHVVVGVVCFFFQHLILMSGFCRSPKNVIRIVQVAIHSHGGYLVFFLGGISAFLAVRKNPCSEYLVLTVLLFITPILFSAAGFIVGTISDRKMGVKPSRKQWPVLEPISVVGKLPLETVKWTIISSLVGILSFIWFLLLIAFMNDNEVTESSRDTLKATGLFGVCQGIRKLGQ